MQPLPGGLRLSEHGSVSSAPRASYTPRSKPSLHAGAPRGIPTAVRRAIKSGILRLRHAVEEDFAVQLAALGLQPEGVHEPGRELSGPERRTREVALAVIEQETAAGATHAAALSGYI